METDEQIYRRALRDVRQKKAQAQARAELYRAAGNVMEAQSVERIIAVLDQQILAGLHGLKSLGVTDNDE